MVMIILTMMMQILKEDHYDYSYQNYVDAHDDTDVGNDDDDLDDDLDNDLDYDNESLLIFTDLIAASYHSIRVTGFIPFEIAVIIMSLGSIS